MKPVSPLRDPSCPILLEAMTSEGSGPSSPSGGIRMVSDDGRTEIDGLRVRLADGQVWTLPYRAPSGDDPEYDALLTMIDEANDRSEGLRAELALTIFLLHRAYDLDSDRLNALLSFEPESPDLPTLQDAIHSLVLVSMERSRAALSTLAEASEGRSPGPHAPLAAPKRKSPLGMLRFF